MNYTNNYNNTNKKIYKFENSLNVGNEGEDKVKSFLLSLDNVEKVESVQEIKKYQEEDIDFIVHFKNNNKVTIEVKTDTYTSGNLYYETKSCIEKNTIGCLEKTKADYIFYYFNKYDRLYILKTNLFRKWVQNEIKKFTDNPNNSKLNKKQVFNRRYSKDNNNALYTSEGYTIPLVYLEEALKNTKIYKRFDSLSKNKKNNVA